MTGKTGREVNLGNTCPPPKSGGENTLAMYVACILPLQQRERTEQTAQVYKTWAVCFSPQGVGAVSRKTSNL